MTQPRIAPGGLRDIGLFGWTFSRITARLTGTTPPNLFRTIGRQRRMFRGWVRFAATMMPRGTLPRRETELVILRVAHLRDCAYEWRHHVHLGHRSGVSEADVQRVMDGPDADGWNDRERTLLTAVDMLHRDGDLDDATWTALRGHLDEPTCIEFLMLAGHYEMLATVINTLRIQPDQPR